VVTAQQARQNVDTATRLIAGRLGFYSNSGAGFSHGDLQPAQQIALTNALADYILANPALFDTGAADLTNPVRSADLAKNEQLDSTGGALSTFLDESLRSARAANPFDALNLPTVAKWLFFGALALGALWLFLRRPARA